MQSRRQQICDWCPQLRADRAQGSRPHRPPSSPGHSELGCWGVPQETGSMRNTSRNASSSWCSEARPRLDTAPIRKRRAHPPVRAWGWQGPEGAPRWLVPRLPGAALALPGVAGRKPGRRGACAGHGNERPAEREQLSLSHRGAGRGCKLHAKEGAAPGRDHAGAGPHGAGPHGAGPHRGGATRGRAQRQGAKPAANQRAEAAGLP